MADANALDETLCGRAFKAFRAAFEEGDTTHFLALVNDDFHFSIPLPIDGWKERQVGAERFNELVRFEREILRVKFNPLIELHDDPFGIVVFQAEGTLSNQPYRNELAVVFEFKHNQICSFKEFVGMPLKKYED
ncbi:nuclear transport factor 2 family protein [Paenibacillus sp. P26]|nr:nuclear transport factor 2 family protein [Paenibacillus sp. P26]UUZ92611.1 nuclear transport factor 2 family protein [Paenibacillus sp. P25]